MRSLTQVAWSLVVLVAMAASVIGVSCKTRPYENPSADLTGFGAELCGPKDLGTLLRIKSDLLILQDRSASMNNDDKGNSFPPPGTSKWSLIRAAIDDVISRNNDGVSWGLMMFALDDTCGIPTGPNVPVGPGTGPAIRALLDKTKAASATPTAGTILSAVDYYQHLGDGQPHYILLATDGEPNCKDGFSTTGDTDDQNAIAAVKKAAAVGIPTFVVGIGSSTGADATLDDMAVEGGEPNVVNGRSTYYSAASKDDLVAAFDKIAGRVVACSLATPAAVDDLSRLTVLADDVIVPRDTTHAGGWDGATDGKTIILYGEACDRLIAGSLVKLTGRLECPTD